MNIVNPDRVVVAQLLSHAIAKHGPDVRPCSGKERFEDCLMEYRLSTGRITALYYNTPDGSTRLVQIREGITAS